MTRRDQCIKLIAGRTMSGTELWGTWGDHMKISEGTDGARPGNGCESYGRKSADVEVAI